MQFFEHQRQAKKRATRMMWLFFALVLLQVAVTNAALWLLFQLLPFGIPGYFFITNTLIVLGYIFGGWWIEASNLSGGGHRLAARLGARRAFEKGHGRSGDEEYRFCNIVQEMAIASRMRKPTPYVMARDMSINAFAAGWGQKDAVVCVTQGALENLNREELMGLVAHEFGHIYAGDMQVNMRLTGMVLGLELLHNFGVAASHVERDDTGLSLNRPVLLVAVGYIFRAIGWVGWLSGEYLKSAVSRQSEYAADAYAVQFTRNSEGIGGVLRKVDYLRRHEYVQEKLHDPAVQHMLLVERAEQSHGVTAHAWFQSHPPLTDRIKRIYGRMMRPLPVEKYERGHYIG